MRVPQGRGHRDATKSDSRSSRETNLATEFFAHLGAGDVDGVLALTAPGFTWKIIGRPGQFAPAGTFDRDEFLGVLARSAPPSTPRRPTRSSP